MNLPRPERVTPALTLLNVAESAVGVKTRLRKNPPTDIFFIANSICDALQFTHK
jgi:hypothetical protein